MLRVRESPVAARSRAMVGEMQRGKKRTRDAFRPSCRAPKYSVSCQRSLRRTRQSTCDRTRQTGLVMYQQSGAWLQVRERAKSMVRRGHSDPKRETVAIER